MSLFIELKILCDENVFKYIIVKWFERGLRIYFREYCFDKKFNILEYNDGQCEIRFCININKIDELKQI